MSDVQPSDYKSCPAGPAPCFQILESTTQFDYEEFIFRWNIKMPFIKQSLDDQLIKSPVFVGGKQSQHSWQLRWQRIMTLSSVSVASDSEDDVDDVDEQDEYQIQLVLVAIGNVNRVDCSAHPGDKIQAHAEMRFTKSGETELLRVSTGNENVALEEVKVGQVWKTVRIKKDKFWDQANGYVVNNVFTVSCKIFVSCGILNSSVSSVYLHGSGSSGSDKCSNNEISSLAQVTQVAFHSTDFADVQLVTETKSIPAHKVFLAARSRVFSAMFKSNLQESKTNSVEIKDFSAEIVDAMLEFIYTGKIVNFTDETDQTTAVEYLRISDKYELLELKLQCERFLCVMVTVDNAVQLLQVASVYTCSALKATVVQFIMRNKQKVCGTDSFKKLADPSILLELFMFT